MEAFSHCRAIDSLLGLFTSSVALLKVCGTAVLVMLGTYSNEGRIREGDADM